MNEQKQSQDKRVMHLGLGKHVSVHFVIYILLYALSCVFLSKPFSFLFLLVIVFICGVHYLLDLLKITFITDKNPIKVRAAGFVLDQLLHIITIVVFLWTFGYINVSINSLFNGIYILLFEGMTLPPMETFLAVGILIIINSFGLSYLIKILLEKITPPDATTNFTEEEKQVEEVVENETGKKPKTKVITTTRVSIKYPKQDNKIGTYVGMIERLLIMIMVVNNALTGIALLIAIKSLTRYKQFDDKQFAEYYLIGTLISLLSAVCVGFITARIL